MNDLLAQNPQPIGSIGEGEGFGPFNFDFLTKANTGPLDALASIISTFIGFITIIAGIYFMIQFLIGGFEWMTASGDKSKLQKAQDRLSHSIIGLIIVIAAFGIAAILESVLGINFLLSNPIDIITRLQLK